MNNFPNKRHSRRVTFLVIFSFVVLVIYFTTFIFYPTLALHVLIPLALLFLSGVNVYQGRKEIKNTVNLERKNPWYKHYNIILALAWLSGFMIFAFYYLTLNQRLIVLGTSVIVLLLIAMIALFIYAFILYRTNDTN